MSTFVLVISEISLNIGIILVFHHCKRLVLILVAEMGFHKGVPWVNAAECILARTKLSYQSPVQDGEANLTRIRGKQIDLFLSIGVSFS